MNVKKKVAALAVAVLTAGMVAFAAVPAEAAGGSDDPTPYTVTASGITLPAGTSFPDNGHVNIKTTAGDKSIHFESQNNQPSGTWIGESFLPWSAFGLTGEFCVTWVQIADFKEHFGEGGQEPVCIGKPPVVEGVAVTLPDPIPATCEAPGALPTTPTTPTGVTWSWSGNTLTATADEGYAITNAPTSKHYVVEPKLDPDTNPDCRSDKPVGLTAPTSINECGIDGDSVIPADDSEGVTYSVVAGDIVATITGGHFVEETPEGWAANDDGTFTFATAGLTTDVPCPIVTTLALPVIVDVCGTEDDSATLPANTDGVTYTRESEDSLSMVATLTDGYVLDGAPAAGWVAGDGFYTYDTSAMMTDVPCPIVTTLALPVIVDVCGTEDDSATLPANTDGVTYTRESEDSLSMVATLTDGYVLDGAPAAGWVAGDGFYTYDTSAMMTDEECTVEVEDVTVVLSGGALSAAGTTETETATGAGAAALSETGTESLQMGALALSLMAIGGTTALVARKRN
ncbi:hypothetical protein [Demequina aurantiaca]|uniref:hypothetical protein n=1 Tax=Demequina aurantiaca TaxID=676200 RepID=UPI003D341DFE